MTKLTITLEQLKQKLSYVGYQEVLSKVGDETVKDIPLSEVVDILGHSSIQCMELVPETETLIKEFTTWMVYDSLENELDGCSYPEANLIQEWLESYDHSLKDPLNELIKSKGDVNGYKFWRLLTLSTYPLYSACWGIYLTSTYNNGCSVYEDKLKKILDAGEWV